MISFVEFLLENARRIEGIKANPAHQNISMDHDPIGKHAFRAAHIGQQPGVRTPEGGLDLSKVTSFPSPLEQSHHVIDQLAKHDPTHENGNKHTEWMVNQYKKGHIRLEDGPRMNSELKTFMQHKDKLANKDLNSYKHPSDLSNALDPHREKAVGGLQREEGPGAKLIHKEGHVTVHKLQTKAGACAYGKGTDWCTAHPDDEHNMFKDYHEEGPLYVVQHHDKETGRLRKHQLHFQSNQFMDEKDKPVDLHHLVKQVPELKNVKEFQKNTSFAGMAFKDPSQHKAHMKNILKNGGLSDIEKVARHVKGKPEYRDIVSHMARADHHTVRSLAAMVGDDGHHQTLIHDNNAGVRNNTVRASDNPVIHEKGARDSSDFVRASAALKVKNDLTHRILMRDGKKEVRQSLAMNPHIDTKHLDKMSSTDEHRWVALNAAESHFNRTGSMPPSYDPGRHNHDKMHGDTGSLSPDYDQAKPGTLKHLQNLHDNMYASARDTAFTRTHKSAAHAAMEKHYPGAFKAIERARNPLNGGIGMHDGNGTKHDFVDHYYHAVEQGWMKPIHKPKTAKE